jgi:hypothetical protein
MLKRAVVVLLVLIAIVAGIWYLRKPGELPAATQARDERDSRVQPVLSKTAAAKAGNQEPPSSTDNGRSGTRALPPGVAPLAVSPLTQAFESSNNLAQLVRDVAARAAAGDAQAARVIAQALDECAPLSIRTDGGEGLSKFPETMPASRKAAALAHIARYRERCAELASGEKMTATRLREAFHVAAQGNDLVDQARRLVESSSTISESEVKDTLRRIVAARDGQAIAAMADAMGENPDDRELFGPYSGSDISVMAWTLVACDLGMPCGPTSALTRQACVAYGNCIPGDYREVIRFFRLSPWYFELAVDQEKKILQAIANGSINDIFP